MLDARLGVRLGSLDLDLTVRVADGEVVAVLGPNGAGKSTALRAVAGLRPIDHGHVVVDGRTLDDPARGVLVPVAARPIGFVFQDHLLFPRLSALDNVAFGLRARGAARAPARATAMAWLDRLGLADHAHDKPRVLSGGQAQRVALARALATEPRLLLLDEPLAALDASTRVAVRTELRRHLATFAGARLLVTHDPVDALVLADRVVVLEGGRVTQEGSPTAVASRPATDYVAHLVGVNLLRGTADDDHTVALDTGGRLTVADPLPSRGTPVGVVIRPQSVNLHARPPEGSARNTWTATVVDLHPDGHRVRVTLAGPAPLVAEVTPAAVADLDLTPGSELWATVKAVDIDAYER